MASLRMHQGSRIILGSSPQPVILESEGNALHVQRGCKKLMTVATDDYHCSPAADPCSAAADHSSAAADPCSAAADPCSAASDPCSAAADPCSAAADHSH